MTTHPDPQPLSLGAFSVSLSVKDLKASQTFYEHLGFEAFGGVPDQGWVMLRNGDTVIGLFSGMFEGNLLTFNPGWDQQASELSTFTDVREIQTQLKAKGITLHQEADADGSGPASLMLTDPDGNQILIDQHVTRKTQ